MSKVLTTIATTSATKVIEMTKDIEYWKNRAEDLERIFQRDSVYLKIREVLKTTPQLSAIIKLFLERDFVSQEAIVTVAEEFGRRTEPPLYYAKVVVWRLRKILPAGVTISTVYADGYSMDKESRNKLKEALA